MASLLSGRELAGTIRSRVALEAGALPGRPVSLAVVTAAEDPASAVYVASKRKACEKAGMRYVGVDLSAGVSQNDYLDAVRSLNDDPSVDAIICQLPLPPGIDPDAVASTVLPSKDVDGFHPENVGRLWRGEDGIFPCTPLGVMRLLEANGLAVGGLKAVVVGRSNIVGKPMAALLLRSDATVTLAHSKTPDLAGVCRTADILVTAVGRPGVIGRGHVREGAIVVDVGISRDGDSLRGDVDFEAVEPFCSYITPVPGGVGPLTIAILLENALRLRRAADARRAPTP